MMHPQVTVFMAAYNVADFIEASILSILNQTFKDFELIIVNDGSTDDTVAVVERFDDPRIRLIHNDKNRGIPFTRNRLLELAQGEYIAILDSDDIAFPDRLEIQHKFLSSHSSIALCGGHAEIIDTQGNLTGQKFIQPVDQNINMFFFFGNPFVNSSVMFRADVFREVKGYSDYALAEDLDLFFRISERYSVCNIDKVLVQYRIHGQNITIKKSDGQFENEKRILTKMQLSLGMNPTEKLLLAHQEVFTRTLDKAHSTEYFQLLKEMKFANDKSKRFDKHKFKFFLFSKGMEIIQCQRKNGKALQLYFDKELFEWSFFRFKSLRRILKISLRGLF